MALARVGNTAGIPSWLYRILVGCCLWLAFGAFGTSYAHQTGNSYLNIRQVDGHLAVDLDFYVRDLGNLLQNLKYCLLDLVIVNDSKPHSFKN